MAGKAGGRYSLKLSFMKEEHYRENDSNIKFKLYFKLIYKILIKYNLTSDRIFSFYNIIFLIDYHLKDFI